MYFFICIFGIAIIVFYASAYGYLTFTNEFLIQSGYLDSLKKDSHLVNGFWITS